MLLTLALTAAMALTLFPIGAFSQSNGGQYRIAVVDMSLLMSEYNKRKEKYDELQKEVDRLQVEIDAMSQRIEKRKSMKQAGRT